MTPLTLQIDGMSCNHCLQAVTQALTRLPGITRLDVRMGRAELTFDPAEVDPDRIVSAVGAAGYRATRSGQS